MTIISSYNVCYISAEVLSICISNLTYTTFKSEKILLCDTSMYTILVQRIPLKLVVHIIIFIITYKIVVQTKYYAYTKRILP